MRALRRHIAWLLGGIMMLLVAGCASDAHEDTPTGRPKAKPVLTIYLYAPDRPVVTRGDIGNVNALAAESAVHSLHVWVFKENTNVLAGHISLTNPEMETLDNNPSLVGKTITVNISDEFANELAGDARPRVDIFVAANVSPYNTGLSLDGSTSRHVLETTLIQHSATDDYFGVSPFGSQQGPVVMAVSESGLPMSGVLKGQEVGGASPVFKVTPRVKLVRAVSKIRFIFSKSSTVADDPHLKVKSIMLNAGVLPRQEYLFLNGTYPERKCLVAPNNYEGGSVLVSNVVGSQINDCDELSKYMYVAEMTGQDYETIINNGLAAQGQQLHPDLSEIGRFYLRESDKPLSGKITYTLQDDTEKEAAFTMKTAGDFSRNHTWIVYAYFVGVSELTVNAVDVKAWDDVSRSHDVYNW